MNMVLGIATRGWSGWNDCVRTWNEQAMLPRRTYVVSGMDVLPAYQTIYEETSEEIIGFLHDDVVVYERGWDQRVLNCFSDPAVGLCGFGGALGHGVRHLYTVPYRLPDLARQDFLSNMRDAEVHGKRFTGERDVAVIDGFAGFVRRPILDKWWQNYCRCGHTIEAHAEGHSMEREGWKCVYCSACGGYKSGGFPHGVPVGYYMLWENLCCEVRRQGYRIRLVGCDCEHLGGRTSTVHQVTDDYEAEHAYFYSRNRDVMPYRVP
jgi:hypothetical protein